MLVTCIHQRVVEIKMTMQNQTVIGMDITRMYFTWHSHQLQRLVDRKQVLETQRSVEVICKF